MSILKRGLGRGLSSLIPQKIGTVASVLPSSPSLAEEPVIPAARTIREDPSKGSLEIPLAEIHVNPYQPRRDFHYKELEDLINSIREHGILQPLVVTRTPAGYELIAGERRLRAAHMLELKTVPVVIRNAKEEEKLELSLIENIQRQDLNAVEKARAYKKLMEEFHLRQESVAKKIGKSRPHVANLLRILTLPDQILRAIEENVISEGHARVIAGLPTQEDQIRLFKKVVQQRLNVREVEFTAQQARRGGTRKQGDARSSPWIKEQEELLRNALGTKVAIVMKEGRGGSIVIQFFSKEDLEEIVAVIVR